MNLEQINDIYSMRLVMDRWMSTQARFDDQFYGERIRIRHVRHRALAPRPPD